MNYDIFQSVPQGSIGAQDAENRRVGEIADELRRLCQLYEAQRGDSQQDVSSFVTEQRVAEAFAKEHGLWIPLETVFDLGVPGPSGNENDTYMAALGFNRQETVGRYSNADYTVWDLIPRNVLHDDDGDIYVVDAEIKRNQ